MNIEMDISCVWHACQHGFGGLPVKVDGSQSVMDAIKQRKLVVATSPDYARLNLKPW